MKKISFALLATLCLLSACKEDKQAAQNSPIKPVIADALLGKWTGVEGTFLEVSKDDGAYKVTIQDLDGPRTFDAVASEDGGLKIERDGTYETITMGDGQDTGMKWLADKVDCLVVKPGEGFCRD